MKSSAFLACLVAICLGACNPDGEFIPNDLSAIIYDPNGNAITTVHAGLTIRLASEKIRELNSETDMAMNGRVLFGDREVVITEATADYIVAEVPALYFKNVKDVSIQVSYPGGIKPICYCLILYQPTVRGSILAGRSPKGPDGSFQLPAEITVDAAGNIYVIDQRAEHDVVLKVSAAGAVSNFAGSGNEFGRLTGIGIDAGRNLLYVADATAQKVYSVNLSKPSSVNLLAGSGATGNTDGAAAAASFRFNGEAVDGNEYGQGLAVDNDGNVYVGEKFGTGSSASQVRKITPAGMVSTVPGSRIEPMSESAVAMPAGLVVTAAKDIYYTGGESPIFQGVTLVSASGLMSRIAGNRSDEAFADGPGSIANFSYPKAITSDGEFLYVADGSNGALRRVSIDGQVITLAGVGHRNTARYCGCNRPPAEGQYLMPYTLTPPEPYDLYQSAAFAIQMNQVSGVVSAGNGLIYVSDYGYRCIWKISIY